MFCEQCGAKLLEGSRFCVNCGAKNPMMDMQETPVQETPVQETPVQETPVQETPVQTIPVQTIPVQTIPVQTMPVQSTPIAGQVQMPQGQTPQKDKKPLPIMVNILLGILLIAVVAGFVIMIRVGKTETNNSNDNKTETDKKVEKVKENPKEKQEDTTMFDLSGEVYEVEILETDAAIQGEEFANSYIIPDSDSVLLDYDTLIQEYTAGDLWFAYYEIFARYGVIFEDDDVNAFFSAKSWYIPTIDEADLEEYELELNEFESENLVTIESAYDELY